ncbi:hypothetical protein SS1G_01915 [Sclerotinia sclerotiorum 1980 UF-70]|uniref:RCC1-like domain-containing protein n=1 Tax=Sclerotinia sclerotiorum (strain ATCC 18683 / 1980 / Ss-1) TaxID=665079 RepID=A7E9D5_SCLS1|nr:hypothetical protein SS1G_01915 [Sclerotinia sclerotiorum 1980 UF-70]EDN96987.1 hypothetical protein SS1G_01915 [Sclerotinia sclerotiorum 1980 UF-70]
MAPRNPKAPANVGVKRIVSNLAKVTKKLATHAARDKAAPAKATKAATTKAATKKVAPKKSKVASKKPQEEDAESGEEEEEKQTPGKSTLNPDQFDIRKDPNIIYSTKTSRQPILTWGVNDGGSLGRDTSANEAPAKDIDADSDSEDEDDIVLNPIESTPTAISTDFLDGRKVIQVLASDSVSLVLTDDGYVYGWGSFTGNDGTIGFTTEGATKASTEHDGDLKKKLKIQAEPVLIPGLKNIKSLARGSNHVLALDNKGTLFTWGAWQQYQLGRRVSERLKFSALTPSPILKRCKAIAAGTYHSFAINQKDQVLAWGLNNFGQTGIADKAGEDDALIRNPTVVKSLKGYKIAQLKGGLHHSIACTEDKEVLVWGRCDYGQMGVDLSTIDKKSIITSASTGKPAILLKPTVVPDIKGNFVSAGIDNCITIDDDGKAWSWGYGENYRTGLGSDETAWTPTVIENSAVKGKKMTFAGCGGQFSIIAGPEVDGSNDA